MASRFLAPYSSDRGLWSRDPFLQLHREVGRLLDDSFRDWGGPGAFGGLLAAPRIDVHEEGGRLEVTAELPGVDQKDIELRLDDDVLTIRGEKRNERQDRQAHITERSYGSFERSIQLPFAPDPDQVRADFKDGVLTIAVPRQDQQERSRRIQIGGTAGKQDQPAAQAGQSDRSAFNFGKDQQSQGSAKEAQTTGG